jgi:ADP-ribosyl-[dinitrogen reductase] hydrolase
MKDWQVIGSGYCVASLEAALWCVVSTQCFEDAVLRAANLGDDADTTAAIAGQLAGALYGDTAIPSAWLSILHLRTKIEYFADALLEISSSRNDQKKL